MITPPPAPILSRYARLRRAPTYTFVSSSASTLRVRVLSSSSPDSSSSVSFFFFNDTATTEIYTLSLHDALPISRRRIISGDRRRGRLRLAGRFVHGRARVGWEDRKSTRLNSSHVKISYAVFCLKKKKTE